jgi:hypothetical protein
MKSGLPPQRLSGCCLFGQGTFAGTRGNGRDAPIPAIPPSDGKRVKPTLSGHSAQRSDSCNVVTFQMEVMRLHPAAISNRPFAPLQPIFVNRGVRSRAIGVLPCSPRPQGTPKSSRFHNFRASTQKRLTASRRRLVVRQTRLPNFQVKKRGLSVRVCNHRRSCSQTRAGFCSQ